LLWYKAVLISSAKIKDVNPSIQLWYKYFVIKVGKGRFNQVDGRSGLMEQPKTVGASLEPLRTSQS
jgi:hypothetical protein